MTLFRLYLLALLIILSGYTLVVIGDYGMNLFAVFFGDMAAVAWPGQFNLEIWEGTVASLLGFGNLKATRCLVS